MTLIVALLTPEFALLASDRRVTQTRRDRSAPGGGVVLKQVDEDTKTTILDGRYTMGFAGLARVRHQETDALTGQAMRERMESWLARTLTPVHPLNYFSVLADEFGRESESQRYRLRHTFLAVGYTNSAFSATLPELIRVENTLAAVHSFHPYRTRLGESPFLLDHAGESPPKDLVAQLRLELIGTLPDYPDQPQRFIPSVRRLYAETAKVSEGRVGAACLITTLPRSAMPIEGIPIDMTPPSDEVYRTRAVFGFYAEENLGSQPSQAFLPAFITSGLAIVGGGGGPTERGPLEGLYSGANEEEVDSEN